MRSVTSQPVLQQLRAAYCTTLAEQWQDVAASRACTESGKVDYPRVQEYGGLKLATVFEHESFRSLPNNCAA